MAIKRFKSVPSNGIIVINEIGRNASVAAAAAADSALTVSCSLP